MSEEATLDEFVEDESEVDGEFIETAAGQLPVDWDTKNVDELCALRNGKATNHTEIGEQQFLVYGSNGPIGSYSESNFDGGLIFGRVGAVGEVERVREPVWVSDNAIQASVTDKCNTDFLYYFLSNKELSSLATKTAQPLLNQSTIGNVTVPSPPLPEQRKIATVLYTVDRVIEKTNDIIHVADRIKEGYIQNVFNSGYLEHESYKTEYIGAREYKFPEIWKVVHLGELSKKITKGKTPSSYGYSYLDSGINFVRVDSINENGNFLTDRFKHISEEAHNHLSGSTLRTNDVLLSIAGVGLGQVAIVDESILPANTNQALSLIRLSDESNILPDYLKFYLESNVVQRYIKSITTQSAQPNINLNQVSNIKILLPPLNEQRKIIRAISDMQSKIQKEKQTREQLKRIKHGLMQDLLSGTVRTTDTNIEIPEEIAQYG